MNEPLAVELVADGVTDVSEALVEALQAAYASGARILVVIPRGVKTE